MSVRRYLYDVFSKSFSSLYITAILGPRRVGKSTLVEYFASQSQSQDQGKKWVFLNLDILSERQRIERGELEKVIQEKSLQRIGAIEPLFVAIDEAQKCPAVFEQIKILYDRYKGTPAVKFILTGSGSLSLHQLSAESLAGRIEIHALREFNLRETTSLALASQQSSLPSTSLLDAFEKEDPLPDLQGHLKDTEPFRPFLETALEEQLVWGGLPEVLRIPRENKEERVRYLGNYFQTYLEKDIRDIQVISDLPLYQKMVEIIAQQTGAIREDKKLIDALGCSRDTLKKYRGFLEATLLYMELYPYIGSSLKRLVKSPKGYLINNGLISYLTGIYSLPVLTQTGLVGSRFENWALKEIQTWLDRDPARSRIYFWRTSGQVEVDLIVEKSPHVIPVEIAFAQKIESGKVKHLKEFLKEEKRARLGIYLYQGPLHYSPEDRILFLPAWALI